VIADVVIGRRFRRRWSAEARPHTRVDGSGGDESETRVPALAASEKSGRPDA
jgi:hypothetical protein